MNKGTEEGKGSRHEPAAERRIPVADEVLDVGKRTVQTGFTRIAKRVHEQEVEVDQPLRRERVEVERVAINRFVDQPVPVRHEGEVTIVPVLEEVLVVEKRLLLKEELHIRTIVDSVRSPQKVTLRKEEVVIEHHDLPPGAERH